MKTRSPTKVHRATGQTKEMDRLYDRLVYWLYERPNAKRARQAADRLGKLLTRFSPDPESIFVEDCRSLVCEAKGDLPKAIKHRENEIRLIRRLYELSQDSATKDFVLRQYDYRDLSDRLELLAMLCHESGDLDRAIRTLEDSRRLCAEHGIKFDAKDMFAEYMAERNANSSSEVEASKKGGYSKRSRADSS